MTGPGVDRPLDRRTVARLIAAQFPPLTTERVRRLGEGWDFEVFVLGDDEWAFRFPKRGECVPWLLRELEVVARVAGGLPDRLPRYEWVGAPGPDFPYPFVGYRFVPGVHADHEGLPRASLAREVGSVLARLHRIDPSGLSPRASGLSAGQVAERMAQVRAVAALVEPRLPEWVRPRAEPYLLGTARVPQPLAASAHRLCHGDISAEHLIVEPRSGRLVGLLDWSDAIVDDPVGDLVGLITVGGHPFLREALAAYRSAGGGADPHLWDRLVWASRVATLTWLGEALEEGADDWERHRRWVERAFTDD